MSSVCADGAEGNGVRSYRDLVAASLPLVERLSRRRRFQVHGVSSEDLASEAVLWLLAREEYYHRTNPQVNRFDRWVTFAVKCVAAVLRRTRGWASKATKEVPMLVNLPDVEPTPARSAPTDGPPEPPRCRRRVRRAVLALSPALRRTVLVKYWLDPPSIAEYDRAEGFRPDATTKNLHRAHKKLRALLAG